MVNQTLIQYADSSGALSTSQIDALCAHKNSSLRSQSNNLVPLPISMLKNSAIGFKMRLGLYLERDKQSAFLRLNRKSRFFLF